MATFSEAFRHMLAGGQCRFFRQLYRMRDRKLEKSWDADSWSASNLRATNYADLEALASDNWRLLPAKPVVDWSVIPVWCNWVAMNEDKQWSGYINKPRDISSTWWSFNATDEIVIPPAYAPKFDGNWKDSLCQRPERS